MALDFSPLANATARLEEGLSRYLKDTTDTQIRDGLIQRFEFTYDLAHKMIRRALEDLSPTPDDVLRMSFPTLIRTADEYGLVGQNWTTWHRFREMRNTTSHTYNEDKALAVAAGIPEFLAEAKAVLKRLHAAVER